MQFSEPPWMGDNYTDYVLRTAGAPGLRHAMVIYPELYSRLTARKVSRLSVCVSEASAQGLKLWGPIGASNPGLFVPKSPCLRTRRSLNVWIQ